MPCYEPPYRPRTIIRRWEVAAIIVLGVPGIWLAIQGFFGAMPLVERLGAFICRHMFGI